MFDVPDYLPGYRAALGALGALAAMFAFVGIVAAVLHRLTGYPGALRWSYTFTALGALAVGTALVSAGWPA